MLISVKCRALVLYRVCSVDVHTFVFPGMEDRQDSVRSITSCRATWRIQCTTVRTTLVDLWRGL